MKSIILLISFFFSSSFIFAQNLKPYIIAFESTESISVVKTNLNSKLKQYGIQVLGQYKPAADSDRWVIIISSADLQSAVRNIGGLSGFGSSLRIGITKESGKTIVSYTNPSYWGNAYFRSNFTQVSSYFTRFNSNLELAFKASGSFSGKSFGSKDGISAKELHSYHYMFGMPRFDDTVILGKFDNYAAAKSKIESSISKGVPNMKNVYKMEIPGKDLIVYGFALSGSKGESQFMPIIDIGNPKHTAFLPYEILVKGGEVHMLHGRYRIALSFPDLTMGTFTKIMSTPGNIEDLMSQLVQ